MRGGEVASLKASLLNLINVFFHPIAHLNFGKLETHILGKGVCDYGKI